MRDSVVSKTMLNVLFKAVLGLQGDEAQNNRDEMKGDIKQHMLTMLGSGKSSDLISCVLALAQTAQMRLEAPKVAEACEREKAFYDGIKALELQASVPTSVPTNTTKRDRAAGGSKLSSSAPKRRATAGGREADDREAAAEDAAVKFADDDWQQLARLYKQLEESDIVRGLYDKFSKQPDTKQALMYELEGRYCKARETYKKLIEKSFEVEEERASWDAHEEPSELEMDLWEDGLEESMLKTHDWKELENWYKEKVGAEDFEDDIWKNRRWLHLHYV
jgi:hypothetical protein